MSIPQDIEEQLQTVYGSLTQNSVDHEINYNEFVAAVMWRRIQYDEEKVGERPLSHVGVSCLASSTSIASQRSELSPGLT